VFFLTKVTFVYMKFLSKIVILIFLVFLSTPTLISMIEKEVDVSMFYSFAEEELQKEIKAEVLYYSEIDNNSLIIFESKVLYFHNNSELPTVFREIFSPPPNFV
jgi:hypothetical protein